MSNIKKTLLRINAIKDENLEIFSNNCRDKNGLIVYRDKDSEVIFINDYYVGDMEYTNGLYQNNLSNKTNLFNSNINDFTDHYRHLEDELDSERRYSKYRQFIIGKNLCDFGCEAESFLKLARFSALTVTGIELQQKFVNKLNSEGINCLTSLSMTDMKFDVVTMFHCLEHLPNPSEILSEIKRQLKENGMGKIIIEVPHARDFLLNHLAIDEFIQFTLWSQHLVLHTRESLRLLLTDAGFKNIVIEGVQRYGLSNHIGWLKNRVPGGHQNSLSILDSLDLFTSYSSALSKIDSNDTLVVVAST